MKTCLPLEARGQRDKVNMGNAFNDYARPTTVTLLEKVHLGLRGPYAIHSAYTYIGALLIAILDEANGGIP